MCITFKMGPEELVLGPDGQLKIQGDKSSSLVQSPAEGDLEASEVFEHVKSKPSSSKDPPKTDVK